MAELAVTDAPQIGLSKESINNLKCGKCQGVLSVPPITMEAEGKFVCGRCISSGTRIKIYEELAKYMKFPCMYEKCNDEISWPLVDSHERSCPKQTMACPFNNCKVNYVVKNILQHFKGMHAMYVNDNGAEITRKMKSAALKNFNPERKFSLIIYNEAPYVSIVCIDYDASKGYQFAFGTFSVNASSKKDKYNVELQISSSDGLSNYNLNDIEIKPFNHRLHCLKCYNGSCTLPNHNKNKNWVSKIVVKNQSDMNATYKIIIHENDIAKSTSDTSLVPNFDTISKITCFCRELMLAPIYICASGHSLCMNCKKNMTYCPICRETITDTRNLVLEQIADTVRTPCGNATKGCKYSGSVKSTKQHSIVCKYNCV